MGSASFALDVLEQDATWEDTSCNILKDGKERGELLFAGLIFLSGQWHKLFSRPLLMISPSLLFGFVLRIFYGSIMVKNPDLIPPDGQLWSVSLSCLTLFCLPASSASSTRTAVTPSKMLCVFPSILCCILLH